MVVREKQAGGERKRGRVRQRQRDRGGETVAERDSTISNMTASVITKAIHSSS